MDNFKIIVEKLEAFIRRYYVNELIKGSLLFFAIGLLYFIVTLLVEHFLWLNSVARAVLFWLFITVEFVLFVKFLCIPLTRLFKLQKGINYEQASVIIGKHFPEVNDKLLNVLQLSRDKDQSELLLASINQKARELSPVPFKLAVNFNRNIKYVKYALIPVVIVLIVLVLGKINWFTDSYKRVVDYRTAYEPPAPFQFFVINDSLQTLEHRDFKLLVKTVGTVVPEQVEISFNEETYILQPTALGGFEYVFANPVSDISFQLQANGVRSKSYTLKLVEVPTLLGFEMVLDYPAYTQKTDEVLKSTGNAVVPEGTKITWILNTKATDRVSLVSTDTVLFFRTGTNFKTTKKVFNSLHYAINTSNAALENFENLNFSLDVIKDQYPEIIVEMAKDSVDLNTMYFKGNVSDDYGLHKLNLVYYKMADETDKKSVPLPISKTNVDQFLSIFPNDIVLEEGASYSMYFEVSDNDVLHNFKRTKSEIFQYKVLTKGEKEDKQLQNQQESIQGLNKSLEQFEANEEQLEELFKAQRAKHNLSFNDKKKLEDVLKRQSQQEQLMKQYNKSFQNNLKEFETEADDPLKDQLNKRLEQNEAQLEKDEELLKELEELQDKINSEELSQKLEELAKQNKNQKRSLEQLLELTKRFYVAKKLEKLQQDLEQLANEQLKQSNENRNENSSEKQEVLNKKFDDFTKDLDSLSKQNKALKKPMSIPRDTNEEQSIDKLQEDAKEKLEQDAKQNSQNNEQGSNGAKQDQKKAGQKMKQMSAQMQEAMQMGGGEQLQEDAEMLRQILDNLLVFSFDEEQLMNQFNGIEVNHNKYASFLRNQYELREYFEHVDDSLFSLSLRQPMLSEQVNTEISNVYFNIDKALDEFSENRIYQGVSSQHYVLTATNTLADFLSNILENMQDQLQAQASASSQGSKSKQSGKGEMQLQDIIVSQQELNKQMSEGNQSEGKKTFGKEEGEQGDGGNNKRNSRGGDKGQKESDTGLKQDSEQMNGELYGIYQRQQELRNQLEDKLKELGLVKEGQQLLRNMESVEMDLLNHGITEQSKAKMLNFEHQLLKLEQAAFQQNMDTKRQSESNFKQFSNSTNEILNTVKQYFNTTEILNRQILPLQQNFKLKVQQYFNAVE
ncbi:hypothetical protein [Formosa sp. S-31]|uniref:hypothetical protein n=1 Tax=Formosa sp. S-31 TaxID=2790949 RepID=UPI003EBE5A34